MLPGAELRPPPVAVGARGAPEREQDPRAALRDRHAAKAAPAAPKVNSKAKAKGRSAGSGLSAKASSSARAAKALPKAPPPPAPPSPPSTSSDCPAYSAGVIYSVDNIDFHLPRPSAA